jgi:hypothetical protein
MLQWFVATQITFTNLLRLHFRGQCYDHNFLLKNPCHDRICAKTSIGLCPEHQFLPNILAKILLQSNHRSLVLLSCNFLFKKLIQQLQRKLSFDNSITMYKELKTLRPDRIRTQDLLVWRRTRWSLCHAARAYIELTFTKLFLFQS